MTGGMMGRTSDTRMYNPHSESSHMYRENHEEESTRTGYEDPRDVDAKADRRQKKKEAEEKEDRKIRHIKVRRNHMGLGEKEPSGEMPEEESEFKPRESPSEPTIPAGAGGFLTSLAAQAKGPGAAAGQMVQMSEPMEHAWSTLLKEDEDEVPDMSNFRSPYSPDTRIPELSMDDLYRLLEHPNERIRFKANEEMDMRSMDAEGSNLPFDVDTTPVGEVAAFYEPQFQDLGFTYGNQEPPSLEEGVYNEEGYDEHYSQARAGDVIEAMPGDIETTPSLAAKYEHLKNTAPPEVVESYRNRMKGFFDENTQGMINTELGIDIPPTYTPQPSKDTYTPEEMMQHNDRIFDKFRIYPSGQKGFTGFKDDWQNILASEPMEHAWSELLKASIEELQQEAESLRGARDFPTARRFQSTANMLGQETPGREVAAQAAQALSPEDEQMPGALYEEGLQSPDFMDMRQNPEVYDPVQRENFMRLMRQMEKHRRQVAQGQENLAELRRDDPSKFFSDRMTGRVQTGEPMDYAWSELLKSKRKTEKRRKKEQRAKWRPSTGKFKRPRGGYTGRSGTSARAKLLSRHIKGGRKSGLMLPHLAVEMSHRGVASKQPMSKDPQAYGQYRAYQEQQNILGNVRPQRGARLPSSQIRMPQVPKPRLKPHRIAPIQPPAMRRPHLVQPKMPSMVTMSEDEPVSSDILKAANRHLLIEMRNELKQLKEMMKRRDRDSKRKGMGEPDTAGAASTMPKYPGNNPKQTTRPEGATEDENDARTWGLDPIGGIVGRGGNRA